MKRLIPMFTRLKVSLKELSNKRLSISTVIAGLMIVLLIGLNVAGFTMVYSLEEKLAMTQRDIGDLEEALGEMGRDQLNLSGRTAFLEEGLEIEKLENENLRDEIQTVKSNAADNIADLESRIRNVASTQDSSVVAADWETRVAYLYCISNGGELTGSGTGFYDGENVYVLTNYHVIGEAQGCAVSFPDDVKTYTVYSDDFHWDDSPDDWAYLVISNPTSTLKTNLTGGSICTSGDIGLGSSIMILGYPAAGATSSITVTRGVVSGADGNFIVTDAKIDHGNSGGAAIALNSGCFIGIPTLVQAGGLESYGRILDAGVIFN